MIRAIALSVCLLCSLAALPTLTNSLASSKAKHHRKHRRHRRHHSKRWWRRHRAALRRKREMAAQMRSSPQLNQSSQTSPVPSASLQTTQFARSQGSVTPIPTGFAQLSVPGSWRRTSSTAGEVRFEVQGENGRPAGTAVLTRLQLATNPNAPRAKSLGGVLFTELRHMVVERMFAAGGWIINDGVREMGGQRVFIVQAASNATGTAAARFGASGDATARVSWNYYFTEINGQIYSLATATTPENAAPLAAATERVLASLPRTRNNDSALAVQATR